MNVTEVCQIQIIGAPIINKPVDRKIIIPTLKKTKKADCHCSLFISARSDWSLKLQLFQPFFFLKSLLLWVNSYNVFINVWYVKTIKPSPLDKTDQNVGGFRFADVVAMGWTLFHIDFNWKHLWFKNWVIEIENHSLDITLNLCNSIVGVHGNKSRRNIQDVGHWPLCVGCSWTKTM